LNPDTDLGFSGPGSNPGYCRKGEEKSREIIFLGKDKQGKNFNVDFILAILKNKNIPFPPLEQ
jgi:hypothetical protein